MVIASIFNYSFRLENYPTFYNDLSTKFSLDITLFRIVCIFLAVFISILVILPGFRGQKKFSIIVRWSTCLIVLFLIFFCNFMPYWEYGTVRSRMPYRFGSKVHIDASLSINIGLRGINITLIGNPIHQHDDTIDFNEYFDWKWSQGKPGFGYDAGNLQKTFLQAQYRGLPYPILWVAETFTIDYEHVRIGRYYRQSGWLAHIFLWTAVPLFILSNILFQMVIYYGSLFIIFTGFSLLSANAVVILLKSSIPFRLAFENQILVTHYSWCFYLNIGNGLLCIIIGIITLIADLRLPDETAEFFGNDVLQCYEDYFADPQDSIGSQAEEFIYSKSDNEVLLRKKPAGRENVTKRAITSGLKKRTISNSFLRYQKSTIRKTNRSIIIDNEEKNGKLHPGLIDNQDIPLYENIHNNNRMDKNDYNIEETKKM